MYTVSHVDTKIVAMCSVKEVHHRHVPVSQPRTDAIQHVTADIDHHTQHLTQLIIVGPEAIVPRPRKETPQGICDVGIIGCCWDIHLVPADQPACGTKQGHEIALQKGR
jgi:hypothetical protein